MKLGEMLKRWQIIYAKRFPECVKCQHCNHEFLLSEHLCPQCQKIVSISNIIAKTRPVILWTDQASWKDSMAFSIPLSASSPLQSDSFNHGIAISDCTFYTTEKKYHLPRRAIITQATRIDAGALVSSTLIGEVTNETVKNIIESKLFTWIFP